MDYTRIDIFAHAFGSSDQSISVVDIMRPGQILIYVNHSFELLTGYESTEIIGKNCRFLQNNFHQEGKRQLIRNAIKDNQSCSVELVNFRKNGDKFTNLLTLSPIIEDDKTVRYYFGIQMEMASLKIIQ